MQAFTVKMIGISEDYLNEVKKNVSILNSIAGIKGVDIGNEINIDVSVLSGVIAQELISIIFAAFLVQNAEYSKINIKPFLI